MKRAIIISLIMANIAFAEILDFDFPNQMEGAEVAGHVLNANPEVVQISKVTSSQATDLYTGLQRGYKHFLYVPTSGLFIASKKDLQIIPIRSRDNDRSGGSVEGSITGKWGDGRGIQWEGSVKGGGHDGKGNYAEGKITQKDDGTGEVTVRGGHERDKK